MTPGNCRCAWPSFLKQLLCVKPIPDSSQIFLFNPHNKLWQKRLVGGKRPHPSDVYVLIPRTSEYVISVERVFEGTTERRISSGETDLEYPWARCHDKGSYGREREAEEPEKRSPAATSSGQRLHLLRIRCNETVSCSQELWASALIAHHSSPEEALDIGITMVFSE